MPHPSITDHLVRLVRRAAIASLVAAPLAATPLAGQRAGAISDTTSALPFRRGQWGMDFGLSGLRTYRIGAVRFTSPTRAWILDGRIDGSIARTEYETDVPDSLPPSFTRDVIGQGGSVSLLVGRRAYRGMGARAMRTVSFGVGGGFGYTETLSEGRRARYGMSSNATAELAVGAHYRLTPSLALGGTLRLGATYEWSQREFELVRQREQRVDVGLGTSDLVLSLFF